MSELLKVTSSRGQELRNRCQSCQKLPVVEGRNLAIDSFIQLLLELLILTHFREKEFGNIFQGS